MRTSELFFPLYSSLVFRALLMTFVIFFAGIHLSPDEAQYWTWSQHLDWGYYSKPPGIAWAIRLGTELFGNTEFGVRFFALLVGMGLPLSLYSVCLSAGYRERTALLAAVALALSPVGTLSSFFATTDGGMVLFWTLALGELGESLRYQKPPRYLIIGIWILFSALFKWTAFLFWVPVLAGACFYPFFRTPLLIQGVGISALSLLPTLIWNMRWGWPTFRHVGGQVMEATGVAGGNFFAFLGAQAALLSPLLFLLLLFSFLPLFRRPRELPRPVHFFGWMTLAILVVYTSLSLFKKIQGNWCVFVYPSAVAYLCWVFREKFLWVIASLALSVALLLFVFSLPTLQGYGFFPGLPNPWKECLGWDRMESTLAKLPISEEDFLFSDTYQMASLLSFYSPDQRRAYFFHLGGRRANQFTLWPGPPRGKTGYFVWTGPTRKRQKTVEQITQSYQEKLAPYFEEVIPVGFYPIYSVGDTIQKEMLILQCRSYNGVSPVPTSSY